MKQDKLEIDEESERAIDKSLKPRQAWDWEMSLEGYSQILCPFFATLLAVGRIIQTCLSTTGWIGHWTLSYCTCHSLNSSFSIKTCTHDQLF